MLDMRRDRDLEDVIPSGVNRRGECRIRLGLRIRYGQYRGEVLPGWFAAIAFAIRQDRGGHDRWFHSRSRRMGTWMNNDGCSDELFLPWGRFCGGA